MYYRYQTKPFLSQSYVREDYGENPTGFQGLVDPSAMNFCQSVQSPLGNLSPIERFKCQSCSHAVQNCLMDPYRCSYYLSNCNDNCCLHNIVKQGCYNLAES